MCIPIIQYLKPDELDALIMGLHRINQKNMSISFIGAGLPKILKSVTDTKSYSERLFNFTKIGSLDEKYTKSALCEPAKAKNVIYTDEAIKEIFNITKGYPYFIQEFGESVWEYITETKTINIDSANKAHPEFLKKLDESFFKSRFDRTTKVERNLMYSMVKCGILPCSISEIAVHMNKKVKSISICRAKLIDKGLIYPTNHGELDFSVPLFDEYLLRINPTLELIK